jgi:hypothetical protein
VVKVYATVFFAVESEPTLPRSATTRSASQAWAPAPQPIDAR